MKINNSSLSAQNASGAAAAQQTQRVTSSQGTATARAQSSSPDDVHLSELVRSLRSLAADSPDRQAKLEQLTRSYASGSYQVNAQATAGAIIDDAAKG